MSLTEVLQATHGRLVSGPREAAFARLVIDSREVTAGGLFVALKGEQQDGHAYIGQAVDRGATGILCERAPVGVLGPAIVEVADTRQALVDLTADRLRRQPVPIVAITGSAGKTTTKELIAHVLGRRLRVHKSEGNLNTYTGIPMTVFQMDPRDRALVGFLGSIEAVAAAKRELVEGLAAGGLAVLNADDPRVRAMAPAARRVTFYGLGQGAQVRADKVRLHGLEGSTFMLHSPRGKSEVFLRIPGQHSISNALAAAAVAIEFGFDAAAVASALHGFLPPSRRMNVVSGRNGATVIDDSYNASPGSMEAALEVLRLAPGGALRVAVLGDMLELGDHAKRAHAEIGSLAAGSADIVMAIGEHAATVVEAARRAGLADDRAFVVESADQAVQALDPLLSEKARVLVKGSRGMRLERVVERIREPS